mgnify:FL=1
MFTGGMHFTDNPLDEGTSRLLVNMIQKDFGQRVRPRGGWGERGAPTSLGSDLGDLYIHHTGTTFVKNTETDESFLRRYALVLSTTEDREFGSLVNSKVVIEEPLDVTDPNFNIEPGRLVTSDLKEEADIYTIRHNDQASLTRIHEMPVENPTPIGIHASIEGNTYLLTPEGLGRLAVYYKDGAYTHEVLITTPLEVTPIQAVNYGYNLLMKDPYSFENKSGPTMRPTGILPYDPKTELLKMQARAGEEIRFRLIYEYKEDEEYKVQWEVQDIYKRDGINVVVDKEKSPTYKNGEDIVLDYTPPLKQFSVVATIYEASDLTNPLRTIILASYHLADDSNVARMDPRNYDLMTAKGMSVWMNQMVYYGVSGAEMSIFISDVNDPTYVPFPNSSITFNEKVIKAFPYMESLMVITEHTMFQVDYDVEDGFTYKPVQANMQLRDDDAASMYGVRNMVCFKSRNYYYMVVPNIKNEQGELQIAPISNSITLLLDGFERSIKRIVSEVYTLSHLFSVPEDEILFALENYQSYADGNRLRHVYKIRLEVLDNVFYLDFHLIYDTIFRTWTIEILESTRKPLHVFQSMSTGYSQFLGLYEEEGEAYIQWVGIDENNPEDSFQLGDGRERIIPNYQLIDTGKRNLEGTKKKRIRQIILEFNNLSKEDTEFNHMVYIDDDPRADLFKYTVEHETDPDSPNYGQVFVLKEYVEPSTVYGVTKLGTWSLNNSQFPEQTVLKLHLDVSGKGYYPRLKLITRTSKLYELNQISWAYREMNAR